MWYLINEKGTGVAHDNQEGKRCGTWGPKRGEVWHTSPKGGRSVAHDTQGETGVAHVTQGRERCGTRHLRRESAAYETYNNVAHDTNIRHYDTHTKVRHRHPWGQEELVWSERAKSAWRCGI